ncbi:MAG TPA: electron transfer flavoprotein subunit alpha/FixB family protein [Verrucomicrobiales bacterium]|nr:electron transfer flavoprotein subunit alpha/FixB family protein [Verrucomicrobiales bacterium]
MKILILGEYEKNGMKRATQSAIRFAQSIDPDAEIETIVIGWQMDSVIQDFKRWSNVLIADHESLAVPTADRYGRLLKTIVLERNADILLGATTTFCKDVLANAAGQLGGAMVGDIIGHDNRDGELLFQRPMYAGSVVATVRLIGTPKILTVRPSSYPPSAETGEIFTTTKMEIDAAVLPDLVRYEGLRSQSSSRPDVTEARVVVSGGRALKNSEDFETIVGGLADALCGATGSSRVLVDNGITPNELQVGQTGKIVAPDLYVALGISGAIQHLAGMKNSKTIIAINNDSEAPIFDVSDYGMVGDIYQIVPDLIKAFHAD